MSKIKMTVAENLFEQDVMDSQIVSTTTDTCRYCEHRQRHQCGGSIIQYCGIRKSKRTYNGLLKIKVTDKACILFQKEIK